ncbi:MAG: DUF916 domain-containing protein [Acidimicrobiales bacterium]|nr:DUF916 domain-containing protein [Acidimicrobiales bacterium]
MCPRRRLLAATTTLLLALGASAPTAWSQEQPAAGTEEVHSWALAPAGSTDPGEAGNRPNLSYELEPGAEVSDAVTLFNYSNIQLTFAVYPTDAFNNEDGQFDLLATGEEPEDLGSWITLPQGNVTVPPQSQATMPISVRVPATARPGDHAGAILASSSAASTAPDGKVITLDRRTGTRVYVRVAGPLEPELAIENVSANYSPSLNPLGGTAKVLYRIQNRGNVRLSGAHSVSIAGPLGLFEQHVDAEELTELLPGEGVTLEATFDDVPASAVAFAKVRLDPASGGGAEELASVSRRGMVLAPPITLLLLALATWLALRARRAYRRHQREDRALGVQPT